MYCFKKKVKLIIIIIIFIYLPNYSHLLAFMNRRITFSDETLCLISPVTCPKL